MSRQQVGNFLAELGRRTAVQLGCLVGLGLGLTSQPAWSQRVEIPRRQSAPPGPPTDPAAAIQKMTLPEGFQIELVASEPQIANPVAMFIDEQGRYWVTESFEYPRLEAGPGRDRIKVLEDTTGDGQVDKVTVFAEGLNIPSGIAVGHGGVWVANAPDLLFLQDTTGDLKADRVERVLTGFGRTDTHELPNAFTWGPDGWLYGLNGVFNHCHVHYTQENPNHSPDHPGWKFTCALWRLHPQTRQFELFAEGTSNPWGIAINHTGDLFISACVIDHLWHIAEGGYYIRQGGPYPPYTWPLGSIVQHKHQAAAYCGITFFDSPAYPPAYRDTLYMGNIHGGCINADVVEPIGSSYRGAPRDDLITANDVWFMPVAQATGPDGCLYVLDWYDRYHCYQDANADPEGVDRAHGRLYRLRYGDSQPQPAESLNLLTSQQLVQRLLDPNVYQRATAQRLLQERSDASVEAQLHELVLDPALPLKHRLHALFALGGSQLDGGAFYRRLFDSPQPPEIRSWAIRLLGNHAAVQTAQAPQLIEWLNERVEAEHDPRILRQMVTAANKLDSVPPALRAELVISLLAKQSDDYLLTNIAYNALRDLLPGSPDALVEHLDKQLISSRRLGPYSQHWLPRLAEQLLDRSAEHPSAAIRLMVAALGPSELPLSARTELLTLLQRRQLSGGLSETISTALKTELQLPLLADWQTLSAAKDEASDLHRRYHGLLTLQLGRWGNPQAAAQTADMVAGDQWPTATRLEAFQNLVAGSPAQAIDIASSLVINQQLDAKLRGSLIDALSACPLPEVAERLIAIFAQLEEPLQPRVVEILTQRPQWATPLLSAIGDGQLPAERLNLNQLQRLASFDQPQLQSQLAAIYGQVRPAGRSNRGPVIQKVRKQLAKTPGDPFQGRAVFDRLCAQCHLLYGQGVEVGPDITRNGRNDFDQLLSNVLDPSAVIGPAYQAVAVLTDDGRVVTGLPTEQTDQRIVLKLQGGKTEVLNMASVEQIKRSSVSLMPEDLEQQATEQELADLFAYLALDRPPEDPEARLLPGAPAQKAR
jgi:putative heme-binding domain-containing protein